MRCPNCGKPVVSPEARPFCSPTCRRLDLGRWLDGAYRIAGPPVDPGALPADPSDDGDGTNQWHD